MTKKKWMRILAFVLVVCVLYAGFNVYSMFSFLNTVSTQKPFSTGDNPLTTAKWEGTEQVNILFMGVDQRNKNERPRSDTMMLASINPTTKQISLFSIMRDTYVNIPKLGEAKINAAFAEGGPELLIETIQNLLDIPIHYYVATDFEGFAKIVDAIGGVDVNVPEKMQHWDDGVYNINLEAGPQHLDGQKALMYVRYRGTPRADFDRTERQRELLKLVAAKLKSPSMLVKMPSILKEVTPYTQGNISGSDIYRLGSLAMSLDTANMRTEQIPPVDALTETYMGEEQVLVPDVQATRKFFQQMTGENGQAANPTPDQGNSTQPPSGTQQNGGTVNKGSEPAKTEPKQDARPKAEVVGEYVNMRQKPGTDQEIIGQVYAGDVVSIEGQDGDWSYVQTQDGMYGYILSSLLQMQ
ncbi:MAG: LCP family protein [Tumebacillaceae bacterium]